MPTVADHQTMVLPVDLTAEERQIKGRELAGLLKGLEECETQKRLLTSQKGEEIKKLKVKIAGMANTIRTGQEYREIPVTLRRNEESLTIETVRSDKNEVVSSRPMTQTELQKPLPFKDAKKEAAEKKTG